MVSPFLNVSRPSQPQTTLAVSVPDLDWMRMFEVRPKHVSEPKKLEPVGLT
jgi:hypothetical protein